MMSARFSSAARFLVDARTALLSAVVLALLVDGVSAQDKRPRQGGGRRRQQTSQPASTQSSAPSSTASSEPASAAASAATTTAPGDEKKDHYFAVINAQVHTVTGPVLDDATILCKNGKIQEIGQAISLPHDCEVVDASDKYVYPGLIASAPSTTIHGNEPPDDTTDVFGLGMNIAVAGGITTAVAGNTAAKLTFGAVENMVIRRNMYVSIGYSTRTPDARRELRADLDRVRQYLRELKQHELDTEAGKESKAPDKEWIREKYDRYLKLLKREAVAVAGAQTRQQLLDLCDLARNYGFRLVIRGAYEGWTVADAMGRAEASAIVTPRQIVVPDERLNRANGSTIENAQILHQHGVTVSIIPENASITTWGVGGRDLLHLNMEAAFAVRGGMSNDDALKSITINAARVLGIDDRVGSLEVGKDADMIVCDGDILNFMTQVHYTVVNGRVAYDKSKDSLYAHIRPTGKPTEPPPPGDAWPKRLEWPSDFVSAKRPAEPTSRPKPASQPPSTEPVTESAETHTDPAASAQDVNPSEVPSDSALERAGN